MKDKKVVLILGMFVLLFLLVSITGVYFKEYFMFLYNMFGVILGLTTLTIYFSMTERMYKGGKDDDNM